MDAGDHGPEKAARRDGADINDVRGSNIILIGSMGSGKSTVGWLLARLMGLGFIDTDKVLEQQERKTVAEFFDTKGEDAFRDLESRLLEGLKGLKSHVIATGGGMAMRDENWQRLQTLGVCVWLNPPPDEIARRFLSVDGELQRRPLLADVLIHKDRESRQKLLTERIAALIGNRSSRYRQADITVSDSFSIPHATALLIKETLRKEGFINTSLTTRPYDRWRVFS